MNVDCTSDEADLRYDVAHGLPDEIDEPVDRIYVGNLLETLPRDDLPKTLRRWKEHPQVTVRTLLVVTGTERSTSQETYTLLRDAGWGVALPYNLDRLALDGWPVAENAGTTEAKGETRARGETRWTFGALCRALK